MASTTLAPATAAELDPVWPAVRAAHIFADRAAFLKHHAEAPWRVRVSATGAAAVLERWRDDSDILAIRGLWCARRAIPELLDDLARTARSQGFERLLSPLVSEDMADEYLKRMSISQRLVSLRADRRAAESMHADAPAGVTLRRSSAGDIEALDRIDRACFDGFWAYGAARIGHYIAEERVCVAESEGVPIGYTLCTVERGSGTLGRLAVDPGHRRRGVGALLVADAVRAMRADDAASVTLCTQRENSGARALYRAMGFRELAGELALLLADV